MKQALLPLLLAFALGGAQAAPLPAQGSWQSTLHARNLAGQAVALDSAQAVFFYDSLLDVTWLRDSDGLGLTNWQAATQWASGLVVGAWDDWRLAHNADAGQPGCVWVEYNGADCGYNVRLEAGGVVNELAHLFHVTLGNQAAYTREGVYRGTAGKGINWGLANTAGFDEMRSDFAYWGGDTVAGNPGFSWGFNFGTGYQAPASKDARGYALALRDGDVLQPGTPDGSVPLPGSLALSGGALLLLLARRRGAAEDEHATR